MQTTSLENVDFYVDEDFAVVYVEATPQQTPREDIREEITNVALELLPYATDTIQVQKPLDGRLQHIEKPHSPAFLPQTVPNTSIIYPLSVPPPRSFEFHGYRAYNYKRKYTRTPFGGNRPKNRGRK